MKFRSVNCLNISRPLKELSKVSVRWRCRKYIFGKVLHIAIKTSVMNFIFSKFLLFGKLLDGCVWSMKIILSKHLVLGDMVKREVWVASYELLVTSFKLKSTSWNSKVRVQVHELRVQIHELRVQIHELRVQIHEFKNHLINENSSKQP